jgi:hypothetical protein
MLFLLVASMMLVVLIRDRILLDSQHWIWKHYEPFKWWLLPHGITAGLALLLGPLQFSSRLRRRHLNWHRISGRLYVAGGCNRRAAGDRNRDDQVRDRRRTIETVNWNHRIRIDLRGYDGNGFRAREARPDRGASTMDDAQLRSRHGICGGSLRDYLSWLGRLINVPGYFLETHHISSLWLFVGISLTAAELILWYGKANRPRSAAAATA